MAKMKQSSARASIERTSLEGRVVRNKILLALTEAEYRTLRPHLEFLTLPHHRSLHEPHRPLKFLHFVNEGLISLVVAMKTGKTVEAGVVGNEGVAGIPTIAGMLRSPLREVVQIGGNGFRVNAGVLQKTLASTPRLRQLLGRFVMVLGMQVAQTAACNRVHNIEQRLARWLLMAHARIHSGRLPITHDFLATMLGTDRPSVTLAAGTLQKLMLIEYARGVVKILDLKRLEQFACECYGVIQRYGIDSSQPSS
ncbi:MAG TPA: Crp/Fnr family transcriptional regulator [Candidatus Dormibacteraeota bacterium]|nr:Crp/Fnr family transcriptional regulator [Candidatus Dormibacteraeota bacterium]